MKGKIVRLVAVLLAVSSFSYVVFAPQRAKAASYSVDFYTPSADTTLAAFLVNSAATVGINLVSEGMDNAELISNIFLFGDDYAQENGYADFRAWWAANRPGVGESALIDRLAWDAGSMVVGSIGARVMRQIGSYIKNRVFGENADSDGGTVESPVTDYIFSQYGYPGLNIPYYGDIFVQDIGTSSNAIYTFLARNGKLFQFSDIPQHTNNSANEVLSSGVALMSETSYTYKVAVAKRNSFGTWDVSLVSNNSGSYQLVSAGFGSGTTPGSVKAAVVRSREGYGIALLASLGSNAYYWDSSRVFKRTYSSVVATHDYIQAQNTNVNFTPPSDDEMDVVFSANSQYEISEILATMGNIALQVDNTAITLQSVVDQVSQQAITVNQTAVSVGELIEEIGKVKTSPGNFGTLGEALGETDIDLMDLIGIVGTIAQILELLQGETVVIQDGNSNTHTVGLPDVIGEVLEVPVPDNSQAEMVLKQILEALEGGQTNSPGTMIATAEMPTPTLTPLPGTPTPTASQIVTVTPVPTITLPPPDDDYPTNDQLQRLGEALTTRFPFCIPWDLYRGVNALNSQSAQAPQVQIDFMNQIKTYVVSLGVDAESVPDLTFTIDFTVFDPLAKLIRWTELIGYGFFLMAVTRKIIWH